MMGKKALERQLGEKEALARAKMLRVSPRKLSLVTGLIRNKDVSKALAYLTFSQKRIAHEVKKVLLAAIANAESNHNLDIDQLYVSHVSVGKALVMKRVHARARGRASRVEKPYSNLRIIVREREEIA
jgi:large subunit ribosomal protein L22